MTQSLTYNQDCIEYMKSLPDKHFSLAVVDPPYGIGVNQMNMGSRRTVKPTKKTWDNETPDEEYFAELFRVSKNQVVWGGNYFTDYLPSSQYFCIWDKGETMYGRDFAECEYAWVSKGGTRIFKGSPNQPERFHPTQKPVKLYEWIFHNYAKQGDTIFDSHLGSGSSRIAAYKAGLSFVGCEIDCDYFNAQEKRFKEFTAQQTIKFEN